jgi:hypothetical protein
MPNPKDTPTSCIKCGDPGDFSVYGSWHCSACYLKTQSNPHPQYVGLSVGKSATQVEYEKLCLPTSHFPGCHKEHLACAQAAIKEAREIINACDKNHAFNLNRFSEWLEKWRTE